MILKYENVHDTNKLRNVKLFKGVFRSTCIDTIYTPTSLTFECKQFQIGPDITKSFNQFKSSLCIQYQSDFLDCTERTCIITQLSESWGNINPFKRQAGPRSALKNQRSLVRYPVRPHTFVSPHAESKRAVVSYWRKNVHEVLALKEIISQIDQFLVSLKTN